MRVNTKPRHKNAPRPAWKVAESYKQWLRGRPCVFEGPKCQGKIEAAHTPDARTKGMGTKAADCNCIPMCGYHHRAVQHNKGWAGLGITPQQASAAADRYWRDWPGRIAWERELETDRA